MGTIKYCGKTVVVKGIVRVNKDEKVLLKNVTVDGVEKDHVWIKDNNNRIAAKFGEMVIFKATVYEYIGINEECEQITKIGYKINRKAIIRKAIK